VLEIVNLAVIGVHLLQWRKRIVLVFFELQLLELLQRIELRRSAAQLIPVLTLLIRHLQQRVVHHQRRVDGLLLVQILLLAQDA
jgi:hypothetical protein